MENKNGNGIFLGVIGVATLIVAIIGATFAYFSASANSATNAISATATSLSLTLTEDKMLMSTALVPANEGVATYATINQADSSLCKDKNSNDVCSIYTFTVTNPSTTTAQDITIKMTPVANSFTNLVYKVYKGNVVSDTATAGAAITYTDDGTAAKLITGITTDYTELKITKTKIEGTTELSLTNLATQLAPEGTITYTMIFWVDETNDDQTEDDANASFAAGITITSGDGTSGVTGTIGLAQK